uniref:ABC transporter channel subunit n=1 Tax=Meteora sporadica TaxID=2913902 RepID=UPI00300153E5|nr:ABC transporter channel subunit [Meteora sporadica]
MISLRVENLSFYRSDKYILKNINFNLKGGDFLYIHGYNGSGKTTLLNILATKQLNYFGDIWMNNSSSKLNSNLFNYHIKNNLLYISHLDSMYENLNVIDNISIWKNIVVNDIPESMVLDFYNLFHVYKNTYNNLSKGQRKKLTLSLLFILNKPIWLLDEPMVSLDLFSIRLLTFLIKKHLSLGGMVIYTSHHLIDFKLDQNYYNLYL